jgi:protein phosphatase
LVNLSQAIQYSGLSDPGKVRSHNEDCIESRPDIGLYVLADGMGGYNAGEVASGMATSLIADGISEFWRPELLRKVDREQAMRMAEQLIREQVARANAAIYQTSQNNPECAGMGTTLIVCLFYDNFVVVAHIGDSRVYRLRGDEMNQVTRDHSLLQEQIDSGLISKEQARLSSNKNLVTRALGIDPQVDAEIHVYEAEPGDLYLLCSDGLNDMVEDEEIRLTMVTLRNNLALTTQQLVQAANDNGGRDNVSVILIAGKEDFGVDRGFLSRLKRIFK